MYGYVEITSNQLISISADNLSAIDGTFIVDCGDCDFNLKDNTYIYNGESFTKYSKRPTPFHKIINNEWVKQDIAMTAIEKRVEEYPPIAEQLDMLYHAMDKGEIPKATEWYNTIKAVKDNNPKE